MWAAGIETLTREHMKEVGLRWEFQEGEDRWCWGWAVGVGALGISFPNLSFLCL